MSTVSKILVVVVLVLAVIFCGIQLALFAQRANWRALYETATATAKSEKAGLQEKITKLNDDLAAKSQEMVAYKTDKDGLTQQVGTLTSDLQEAKSRATQQEALAKEKEDALAALQEKVDNMIKEITSLNEKMRRDAQDLLETRREYERVVNQLTALRDKNNDLLIKLKSTQRELEASKSDVEKLTFSLKKYAQKFGEDIPEIKSKKIVRAHVLAASNESGYIMLSAGKDDEVEAGDEFIIHRGEAYICKVRVVNTYPDSCAAKIITETLVSKDAIVNISDNAFRN